MTIFNISYKYRLYPNNPQAKQIAINFECCRKIYNLMLQEKIREYERTHQVPIVYPEMYFEKNKDLLLGDKEAYSFEQYHLEKAFRHYLYNKDCSLPHPKVSKYTRKSYTTRNKNNTIQIIDNKVNLPTLGMVKAKIHRLPLANWIIKSATISQDGDDKYYVSILFKAEKQIEEVPVDPNTTIGLDYKSDGLYMSSNGKLPKDWRKCFREGEKKISKAEKQLKRKVKDSNNYKKQMKKIAKIHKHIANQRQNILHKLSKQIAENCSAVCVEDLNMKKISRRSFHNGKSTMDNAYATFITLLEYKLKMNGKKLIKVDRYYPSSQICSNCGRRHKMLLSERKYKCECGLEIDRDYNAAINIRNEGLKIAKLK